jgi:hypothetical protein
MMMMESRRRKRGGHVALIGRRGMHIGYWCKSQRGDHFEYHQVGRWIILRWVSER